MWTTDESEEILINLDKVAYIKKEDKKIVVYLENGTEIDLYDAIDNSNISTVDYLFQYYSNKLNVLR